MSNVLSLEAIRQQIKAEFGEGDTSQEPEEPRSGVRPTRMVVHRYDKGTHYKLLLQEEQIGD